MCLDRKGTFKPAEVGYKVMEETSDGYLRSPLFTSDSMPLGEWLNEKNYRERHSTKKTIFTEDSDSPYPVGWHIFNTINGARHWRAGFDTPNCIVNVEVRRPVAKGYQEGHKVTVAKQIKILRIVEGW